MLFTYRFSEANFMLKTTEPISFEWLYDLKSLKYLPSGPFQKKFANLSFRGFILLGP